MLPRFLNFSIVSAIALIWSILCLSASARADTWTKAGKQEVTFGTSGEYNTGTLYVSPRQVITFNIVTIIENDTKTPASGPAVEEDDPEKEVKLFKSAGPNKYNWTVTTSAPGPQVFTVPATAVVGEKFRIRCEIYDKRAGGDRHDTATTIKDWNYEISTACPDALTVDGALEDLSGSSPAAGQSYGHWKAHLKATGAAPAGRLDWNGTRISGERFPFQCDDTTQFTVGMNGKTYGGGTFTYTLGSDGDDRFFDTFTLSEPTIVLRGGVNSATGTQTQQYVCLTAAQSPPTGKIYVFTVSHQCDRLQGGTPNARVKDTVTLAAVP